MKYFFVVSAILLLSACGFSLRVPAVIEDLYQPVHIVTPQKFDPISVALVKQFNKDEVAVAEERQNARSRLNILSENESKRDILITTQDSDQVIFVLSWIVDFSVQDEGKNTRWKKLIDKQFVSASKIVKTDLIEQVTGNNQEELRIELRQQLVEKIVRQIAFLKTKVDVPEQLQQLQKLIGQ